MSYTFAVITKVPKVREGNEYDQILVQGYDKDNEEVIYHLPKEGVEYRMVDTKFVNAKLPVFHLGEVLILDGEYGREMAGLSRKPSKWSVEVEHFDNLEEAIDRAHIVLEHAFPIT
jgi:phage-related protein